MSDSLLGLVLVVGSGFGSLLLVLWWLHHHPENAALLARRMARLNAAIRRFRFDLASGNYQRAMTRGFFHIWLAYREFKRGSLIGSIDLLLVRVVAATAVALLGYGLWEFARDFLRSRGYL